MIRKNINEAVEEFGKAAIEAVDPSYAQAIRDNKIFKNNKDAVSKAKKKEVDELAQENQPFSHAVKKNADRKKLYLSESFITEPVQIDIKDFKPWEGGADTMDIIIENNKLSQLDALVDELYPEGITEDSLNDLLWFERDWILNMLGIEVEE